MRTIQTLTTQNLAYALAKSEEGTGANFAPSDEGVARIKRRLDNIAESFDFDPQELRGDQSAKVQDRYFETERQIAEQEAFDRA